MMKNPSWWQQAVVYQIYPRSFQDSNGDGIGDLTGIAQRLDYLRWLGVDAIWLSPIYVSPMKDFGYDVADYCAVDPMFGTLADFDYLIAQAAARHIRVILDYVPNHTSDQHPWFQQARQSRANPKRDWYLWRDPRPDGGPPNNWLSEFGGPAWTYDAHTGQYYLHSFLPQQPDLNWRHPEVVTAMLDVLRFWLDRGVAGFRIDVVDLMLKDAQFRDDPPNPDYDPQKTPWPWASLIHRHSGYQPEVHQLIRQIRALLESYGWSPMARTRSASVNSIISWGQRPSAPFTGRAMSCICPLTSASLTCPGRPTQYAVLSMIMKPACRILPGRCMC
jgi:alpha-glucosidase